MADIGASIEQYGHAMQTIKWRTDAISKTFLLVNESRHYLEPPIVAEFCLLQLRYCCELLAIGCIAIHKDVPQSRRLHKEWNASDIMSTFTKIKPNFFPKPIRSELQPDGHWIQHEVLDALTKTELIQSYHLFGSLLHSGTFENFTDSNKKQYNFEIIQDFMSKLVKLLSDHIYLLYDGKTMVRVIMNDVQKGGAVSWNVLMQVNDVRANGSR